jgi:hypothetical protein
MYQILESPEFTGHRSLVAPIHRGDHALRGLLWAIRSNPNDFPVLQTHLKLRLAKSEQLSDGPGTYSVLYVWFIIKSAQEVELLELEVVPVPQLPYQM